MKNNFVFICLLMFLCSSRSISGQVVFETRFRSVTGQEGASSGCQTFDGGYLGVGYSSGLTVTDDALLIRTDQNGDTLWTKAFDKLFSDVRATSVLQTPDSGFFIFGYLDSQASMFLTKVDVNGSILWHKFYSVNNYYSRGGFMKWTHDGNIIVLANGTAGYEFIVMKLDTAGTVLLAKKYITPVYSAWAKTIHETAGGDFIISGYTNMAGTGNEDAMLIKLDSAGNILWTKMYGGVLNERASDAIQIPNGNFLICGYSASTGIGMKDMMLLKTDSNGIIIWSRTYGGIYDDFAAAVGQCWDGNYFMCGTSYSLNSGDMISILKINSSNGYLVWDISHDSYFYHGGNQVAQETADSGFVCFGNPYPNGPFVFFKTDSLGRVGCNPNIFHLINANAPISVTDTTFFLVSTPGISMSTGQFTLLTGLISAKDCFSSLVSIADDVLINTFVMVYPNPFTDELKITFPSHSFAECSYTIKNLLGQKIKDGDLLLNKSTGEVSLDLKFLDSGMYLLDIFIDGERTLKKIIKQ
jgi:hypothetical protein